MTSSRSEGVRFDDKSGPCAAASFRGNAAALAVYAAASREPVRRFTETAE
jgi:hypothetical protein